MTREELAEVFRLADEFAAQFSEDLRGEAAYQYVKAWCIPVTD